MRPNAPVGNSTGKAAAPESLLPGVIGVNFFPRPVNRKCVAGGVDLDYQICPAPNIWQLHHIQGITCISGVLKPAPILNHVVEFLGV